MRTLLRLLLVVLGGCQLLMAARAPAVTMIVGVVSGLALIAAAVIERRRRALAAALVALGTIPFAVVAWRALVPFLVLVVAAVLAGICWRRPGARTDTGGVSAG